MAPRWPDGIRVRGFARRTTAAVYETHMETFEDSWEHTRQPYEEWAHWTLPAAGFRSRALAPRVRRRRARGDRAVPAVRLRRRRPAGSSILGVRRPWRRRGLGKALPPRVFRVLGDAGCSRVVLGVDAASLTGAHRLYESVGHARVLDLRHLRARPVSRLRARCPDCRTLTAVALGPEYQCHSCGREFGAGLVRVPRAWGPGGEAMAAAAWLELPYPETGVVEEATLAEQSVALAADLPGRPLVLGGCCCSHVGAVEGLAARDETLAVVWIDAHGDLNTPASLALGQRLGDAAADAARRRRRRARERRARRRPQPRSARGGVHRRAAVSTRARTRSSGRSTGADAVYVALDCDAVEPGELAVFMPEPDGHPPRRARGAAARRRRPDARRRSRPHGARRRRGERAEARLGSWSRALRPVTAAERAGSKLNRWPKPRAGSTSRSSTSTRRPSRRRSSIRTRAPRAARTTATTSSRRRCASARTAATTSRSRRASGSSSSPTRTASRRRPPTSAPPIRSSSSTCARTRSVSRRPRWRPGLGDAMVIGSATIEAAPVPARGHGLLVHGRLDGLASRARSSRAPARAPPSAGVAARLGLGVGRRAHAGGDPRADAAAEDRRRRRGAARGRLRAHQRHGASDDRRPARELRQPRRRAPGRAGRAHVVRRPARRRADDAREAARRLRPRRVEPPLRPRRRDRPARGAAARRSRGCFGLFGTD